MCSSCARSADLGLLLGMALGNQGLEMWPLTQNEECAVTGFLRDKLQYRNRLQYMVTVRAAPCSPAGSGLSGRRPWAPLLRRLSPEPPAPFSSFPTAHCPLPCQPTRRPPPLLLGLTFDPTSTGHSPRIARMGSGKPWGNSRSLLAERIRT